MYIIGYIHVCQRGNWQRSFKMLIDAIKNSQLYNNVNTIRIGVVNDYGKIIEHPLLNDNKFELLFLGKSDKYERPTLLHMRDKSDSDPEDTLYFYLHTKGITRFGTNTERNVIGWINLMLYWNIARWRYATDTLNTYNTYGCEYITDHYSGNFWWATGKHIKKLPKTIENYYVAPEKWVTINKEKMYCAYCSGYGGGGLYSTYLSPEKYMNLNNTDAHKINLNNLSNKSLIRKNTKTICRNNHSIHMNNISGINNISTNKINLTNKNNTVSDNIKAKINKYVNKPLEFNIHKSNKSNKNNKFTINNLIK